MTSAVLDTSALLALLRGEPGGEKVRAVLSEAAMTTTNLAELVGYYARNGADEADTRQILSPLPIEWVAFDAELAFGTGMLLPVTRSVGLSLGDRACLSLARHLGLPAMTADRSWLSIAAAAGVTVDVIR